LIVVLSFALNPVFPIGIFTEFLTNLDFLSFLEEYRIRIGRFVVSDYSVVLWPHVRQSLIVSQLDAVPWLLAARRSYEPKNMPRGAIS